MEKYDLVDSDDRVIGVTNKEEAHKFGYIHRVVAVFVFTQDGKLCLQEHIKTNNAYDHSVGGHVVQGESYDDAARREAFEELNITDPLTKIATFLSHDGHGHMFGLYEVTPSLLWKFKPNREVQRIIPMPLGEVVDLMNRQPGKFTHGFRWTMSKYLEAKNLPYSVNPGILRAGK